MFNQNSNSRGCFTIFCPKNTLLAKKSTERGEVACLGAAGSRSSRQFESV